LKAAHDYTYRWCPGLVLVEERLTGERVAPNKAKKIVKKLAEEFGVPAPRVEIVAHDGGKYIPGDTIVLDASTLNMGALLHEFAHHLHCWRGPNVGKDLHGEQFCKHYRMVVEKWMEVPSFPPYTPPRFTRKLAERKIAETLPDGADIAIVKVEKGLGNIRQVHIISGMREMLYLFRLTHPPNDPYTEWTITHEFHLDVKDGKWILHKEKLLIGR